jgi:hypothetical protein
LRLFNTFTAEDSENAEVGRSGSARAAESHFQGI